MSDLSPIKVIIVEDNDDFRNRFETLVKSSPECEFVGSARTAAEGVNLVEAGGYDVLLCDIGLPDFSGIEVMRSSAANHPNSDIMVISLFGDEEKVIDSLAAGAKGYILKDDLPEDFIPTIKDLRAGNSPISPKIARGLLKRFDLIAERNKEPSPLTEKETMILKMIASGMPLKKVATELDVSVFTINWYTKSIYKKLGVNSKMQATSIAGEKGWLQ
jgi:DNA-binding NarL/FixJ family response regulator